MLMNKIGQGIEIQNINLVTMNLMIQIKVLLVIGYLLVYFQGVLYSRKSLTQFTGACKQYRNNYKKKDIL